VSLTFARFRAVTTRAPHGLARVVLALAVGSCQKAPADVREWSPKDHTNTSNKPAEQTGQVNANPAPTETPPKGLDPVTLAAWGTQCSSCHGKIGKGDGPTGKMVKAKDLSNPDWQAQITDEQIMASITAGKNAMPSFANLPKETVENLMWLVRWFNSDQTAVQARMDRLKATPPIANTNAPGPSVSTPAPTAR
jgi:mono/diheme cytochrome c family protein